MSGLNKLIKSSDVKGDTAYDVILRAWLDHSLDQLPEDKAKMLRRWEDVDRLIRNGELVQAVGKSGDVEEKRARFTFSGLVQWLKQKHGVSVRTAYEDIRNAKRFFLCAEAAKKLSMREACRLSGAK